jgi:hypothetical protein
MIRSEISRALLIATALVALAACGDDATSSDGTTAAPVETTAVAEKVVGLRYEANGGCQMMGPNCATFVIYTDGTVEIYRTGENAPAEITGSIPADEITAFLDSVDGVDFQALAEAVGPGTCQACVDGIDAKVTISPDEEVLLDSTIVNFDPENEFFAALDSLMQDVYAVGELPIQQRG